MQPDLVKIEAFGSYANLAKNYVFFTYFVRVFLAISRRFSAFSRVPSKYVKNTYTLRKKIRKNATLAYSAEHVQIAVICGSVILI